VLHWFVDLAAPRRPHSAMPIFTFFRELQR
jgi:hypothetical protein